MKKVISITLALVMLCLGVVAFADAAPSKTTEDLLTMEAVPANPVEGSGFFFFPVTEKYVDVTKYQAQLDAAAAELEKIQKDGAETYFGEETVAAVKAINGAEKVTVDELFAVVAGNYEETMGDVTVTVEMATPYAKDQKVAVLVGDVTADGAAWKTFEGVGVGDAGAIQVVLDPATVLAVQNGIGLFAVAGNH